MHRRSWILDSSTTRHDSRLETAAGSQQSAAGADHHSRALVTNQRGDLLSFGIIAALWTASNAVAAVMDNLHRAYNVQEGRPFWQVHGIAILLAIGISVFIIVLMTLLIFGPKIGSLIASQVSLAGIEQVQFTKKFFTFR